ncbi:MAG: hypothetical protein ACI8VC_000965 [Candidatus Endobugula sp.]|jgi:hypothetical protein
MTRNRIRVCSMPSINNMIEKLDALKHQGADEYDPIRFCFIESLAHRATTQREKVRELLEMKIQQALDDYYCKHLMALKNIDGIEQLTKTELGIKSEQEQGIETEQEKTTQVISALVALRHMLANSVDNPQQGNLQKGEPSGSAEVIESFNEQLTEQEKQMQHQFDEVNDGANNHAALFSASSFKSSVAYQKFQHQKRIDHFIDNALNETPENPGPLNPEILAIRLLQQINNLSPEYISRYVGYFETLQWLAQEIRPSKLKS